MRTNLYPCSLPEGLPDETVKVNHKPERKHAAYTIKNEKGSGYEQQHHQPNTAHNASTMSVASTLQLHDAAASTSWQLPADSALPATDSRNNAKAGEES